MKIKLKALIGLLAYFACIPAYSQTNTTTLKKINQVNFSNVTINDDFWSPRLKQHITTTLPVCIDQIENKTGRIQNFERAALGRGEHSGIYFDDSDVYKALEGMAYALSNSHDPKLEAKIDEWIDKMLPVNNRTGI